jgi:hypothetical protein
MTATNTTTARLPKRKVYQEFYDFLPNLEKEVAEYKKAILTDIDTRPFSRNNKKGQEQEPYSWPIPRELEVKQNVYNNFVEQAVNPKSKNFYQEKDENGATINNTGATFTVRSIVRTRLVTGEEFLLSKGDIHAFNSFGEPIKFFVSYPEKWNKPIWSYKSVINPQTHNVEKQLQGPQGNKTMYELPFNQENLKQLYDQRENDLVISLAVKDDTTGRAVEVKDVTSNPGRSYELFAEKDFDYLFNSKFIPEAIKIEQRQKAVAEGLIGGNMSDYQPDKQPPSGKNLYK